MSTSPLLLLAAGSSVVFTLALWALLGRGALGAAWAGWTRASWMASAALVSVGLVGPVALAASQPEPGPLLEGALLMLIVGLFVAPPLALAGLAWAGALVAALWWLACRPRGGQAMLLWVGAVLAGSVTLGSPLVALWVGPETVVTRTIGPSVRTVLAFLPPDVVARLATAAPPPPRRRVGSSAELTGDLAVFWFDVDPSRRTWTRNAPTSPVLALEHAWLVEFEGNDGMYRAGLMQFRQPGAAVEATGLDDLVAATRPIVWRRQPSGKGFEVLAAAGADSWAEVRSEDGRRWIRISIRHPTLRAELGKRCGRDVALVGGSSGDWRARQTVPVQCPGAPGTALR